MIITKELDIIINSGNISIYRRPGIKIGDIIKISIDELSHGSKTTIIAFCCFCNTEISIQYKYYIRSIKKNDKFACSKKCSSIRLRENLMKDHGVKNISMLPDVKNKIKETNLKRYGSENFFGSLTGKKIIKEVFVEKYGVDNPQKNIDIQEKTKKTNLERYGCEFTLSSEYIRDKIEETNLEKYGYIHPSKSTIIKDKIVETNKLKYGGNSPMSSKEVQIKSKKTLFDNYGVYIPLRSEVIKERSVKTNLEVRGVEYPSQCNEVKLKIEKTNLEKYGHAFIGLSELLRKKWYGISNNEFYIKYLSDRNSLFMCDSGKDHNFEIHADNYFSRIKNNISLCTVCYPISQSVSIKEKELLYFIKSIYNGEIITSYRNGGLEIDIYLPELKIGFEFNGLYWHSEIFKDKNYHLNKTNHFKIKNIRIIHIWEDEWKTKNEIIKSQIKNQIGLSIKIYARNCFIKEVDIKNSKKFLNNSHIQGYDKSLIKIGLYYNNELVSLMTFNKLEGRKKMDDGEWNLSRFCNLLNLSVVGGASKIINYFIKKYNPKRIISYADASWSNGKLYEILKFKEISKSSPDYKYNINGIRRHKQNFKKSKLDTTIYSESEYMRKFGFFRIWDCGKIKYELMI